MPAAWQHIFILDDEVKHLDNPVYSCSMAYYHHTNQGYQCSAGRGSLNSNTWQQPHWPGIPYHLNPYTTMLIPPPSPRSNDHDNDHPPREPRESRETRRHHLPTRIKYDHPPLSPPRDPCDPSPSREPHAKHPQHDKLRDKPQHSDPDRDESTASYQDKYQDDASLVLCPALLVAESKKRHQSPSSPSLDSAPSRTSPHLDDVWEDEEPDAEEEPPVLIQAPLLDSPLGFSQDALNIWGL